MQVPGVLSPKKCPRFPGVSQQGPRRAPDGLFTGLIRGIFLAGARGEKMDGTRSGSHRVPCGTAQKNGLERHHTSRHIHIISKRYALYFNLSAFDRVGQSSQLFFSFRVFYNGVSDHIYCNTKLSMTTMDTSFLVILLSR